MAQGDLSQAQWQVLEAVLPAVKQLGRRPRDRWRVINGTRWRIHVLALTHTRDDRAELLNRIAKTLRTPVEPRILSLLPHGCAQPASVQGDSGENRPAASDPMRDVRRWSAIGVRYATSAGSPAVTVSSSE